MYALIARRFGIRSRNAARESLLLGRQTISLLMNDPLLPEDFVDVQLREQFALSVQQLDQTGLELWRKFYHLLQVFRPLKNQ